MKFFIASPWKNKMAVEQLTQDILSRGHDVYSFLQSGANLSTGHSVMEELKMFSAALQDWQHDPSIKAIFNSELEGLKGCDALVLLEPSGHSSLIEAGIAFGMGKRVAIVGTVGRPEVFYLICRKLYPDTNAFLNDLSSFTAP